MKSYITKLLILTLILTTIGAILFTTAIPQYYLPVFPFVLLFFSASSAGIHAFQLHMAKTDLGKFTRSNMLLTFVKLVGYSAIAIIYIAADKENAKIFAAVFLLLYLVFAVFEVIMLSRLSSQKK